jgi:UDP-N-acetyl-2-amino-2-deoxyglucuronate dehydrogenase
MTIRVGIVGGGNISETHARAAAEISGVEVAAVYGQNTARAAALAERFGAAAYAEYEAFLRHRPLDVVLIGSPSGVHAEQGVAAARQGLHVLVEKPLDITTERADDLVHACETAGVKLGVFFQDRTAPGVAWLKRLIESGGLGRVFLVSARLRWYRPPEYYADSRWRGTFALDGGGALMNQGIHTADLLLWLLGDVDRVWARTRTALHSIEVEDTVAACLEFSSGAVGTLEATTAAYPGYPRRVEVTGTEGTVVVEGDRLVSVDLHHPPAEPPPLSEATQNPSASSPTVSDVSGHRRVLEDFQHAIETGATPLCNGRDGRRSVELVQSIYESGLTGRVIELDR